MQFIDQLETPEVRLLARSVFAPALLTLLSTSDKLLDDSIHTRQTLHNDYRHDPIFKLDSHYKNWLSELDAQPQKLLLHLLNSPKKLGIYHEHLWAYFLANCGRTRLIARNLKVRNSHRDLGELDFIYQHQDYGVIHLEVACKFYLANTTGNCKLHDWIGPNRADNFERKINHSINHQLPLSDLALANLVIREQLAKHNVAPPDHIHKQLHIGGRLFYASHEKKLSKTTSTNSAHVNPSHLQGQWLTYNQWRKLVDNDKTLIAAQVKKPGWLDASKNILAAKNDSAFIVTANQLPCLIACESALLNADFVFIVPDDWSQQSG